MPSIPFCPKCPTGYLEPAFYPRFLDSLMLLRGKLPFDCAYCDRRTYLWVPGVSEQLLSQPLLVRIGWLPELPRIRVVIRLSLGSQKPAFGPADRLEHGV